MNSAICLNMNRRTLGMKVIFQSLEITSIKITYLLTYLSMVPNMKVLEDFKNPLSVNGYNPIFKLKGNVDIPLVVISNNCLM